MDILLKNVTIIDKASAHHLSKKDLFISNGIIQEIAADLTKQNATIFDAKEGYVSHGWIDVFSNFADPGMEYREILETGAEAALAGGYTKVFAIPNTKPVVDNKSLISYIKEKSKSLKIQVYPLGAISQNAEGHSLAEMYDMYNSGAIAFSDGTNPVQSPGLFLKALQYVKAFDGVLVQLPFENSIGAHGLINEGIVSTQLGLPGMPAIAEELMIMRDIELLRYTDSKLHITGVSSAKSVALIAAAKKEGLKITCSVTPYHLLFTDKDLQSYDTNLKCNPPLRTSQDQQGLKTAVLDGTIDMIATHHFPQHFDDKVREFEFAKNGMIGLQTTYAALMEALPNITPQKIVELLCYNAAKVFAINCPAIEIGTEANLTVFNSKENTIFTKMNNKSKSQNSPFFDKQLKGKVLGTIVCRDLYLNQ